MVHSNEAEHDRIQQWYAEMCATGPEAPMTPSEFRGLYGNVVTADAYGIRTLDFVPDVILDIGANVGVFARFARSTFPSTQIVCVEPSVRNLAFLKHLTQPDDKMVFLNKAIGEGTIYKALNTINGAHEVYFGDGSPSVSGFILDTSNYRFVPCKAEAIMLDRLAEEYCPAGPRLMVKIDIESAELAIFDHPPSVNVLANADYFAIELHGQNFNTPPLDVFHKTHIISQGHTEWRARKR